MGCGYVDLAVASRDVSLDEMEMQPAGMMLWISKIFSQGVPVKTFVWFSHVALMGFALLMFPFCLIVVGGLLGGFLLLMFFLMCLVYFGFAFKGHQFLRDGNAQLAWFQKPFWEGILMWCRSRNWQGFDNKTRDRPCLDLRNQPITDEVLAKSRALKDARIVDLEGTKVTDECLLPMYRMKRMQCLVLKDTAVTHLGVTRLQQSVPHLWIWY